MLKQAAASMTSFRHVLSVSAESFVPLGAPLMDTRVEVRDDQGGVVTEGEGQVFIGDTLTHTRTQI